MRRRLPLLAAATVVLLAPAAPAHAAKLRAGVGKADITPQTGYYLGGWTRADRVARGQHTRLHARALVLKRGRRKVALVAVDLFMVPGGMVKHIGDALARRGFSEQNVLVSASHTHSGPGGFANYPTFNTAAPSMETVGRPDTFVELFNPKPADPQLYTFLTRQISAAIRRADDDLGPAAAAWGETRLLGVTRNRSVEAHLANHGILREHGQGSAELDPEGAVHTIDPAVSVLRVDKYLRRRGSRKRTRVPVGAWTNFANHGTVTKSSFQFYNQDHHASAIAVFEERIRRKGKVPRRQQVINVYGNSDEGDQSAGLDRHGPAASDWVGRREAEAMLAAWRRAGKRMTRSPRLDFRWTRTCWCGQEVDGGRTASNPEVGLPFFTGSEEERGPLYDVTRQNFEGRRNPVAVGPHGHKIGVEGIPGDVPKAVPLMTVRVGSRLIASVPGEGTKGVGDMVRSAVTSAVAGSGVRRVVVSGLANEFVLYFTTPGEHDRQHYEGGQTLFGRLSSALLSRELATLAGRLVRGEPGQPPYPFDPTNGVRPDGPAYGAGGASGGITLQPPPSQTRMEHVWVGWRGGPRGLDRPVGRPFLSVQRRVSVRSRRRGRPRARVPGRRRKLVWRHVASDLGLQMLWRVSDDGLYGAYWDVPYWARPGRYRFVVTGKRYRLVTRRFRVRRSNELTLRGEPAAPGTVAVSLRYPRPVRDRDLNWRPLRARGGVVRFLVNGRPVRVRRRRANVFAVRAPTGSRVEVRPGAARDRFGNRARNGLSLRG